ncbi:MAG: pilus assembly protein PilP [Myxococcales bacterium]
MNRVRAILALALVGAACGSPPPPPRRAPPATGPAKTAAETDASQEQQTMYVYSPVGKRDPFQNVFGIREAATQTAHEGRKPTPLQKWSLDQLRLALTVTGTASPMAMVEVVGDPQVHGYPVRLGDFVGKNWGKVTSIQRDQIVVTETITDHNTGRVYPQNITLQVPRSTEEQSDLKALQEGEEMVPASQQAQSTGGR